MRKLIARTRQYIVREEVATVVEYGLMGALIAVLCVAGVTLVGTSVSRIFNDITGKLWSSLEVS